MTLNQQIARSQLHHTQHTSNLELSNDPCCPICYPIQEDLPLGCLNFWRWLQAIVPPAHRYNANTLVAFQAAEQLHTLVQQSEEITVNTQGIFKAYKNIYQTIIYRDSPLRTLGDLTYITTVASLLSSGFLYPLDYRAQRSLVQGLAPLQPNQPLYQVVEHLRTAWSNNRTNRQHSPDPIVRTSVQADPGPSTSTTTTQIAVPFP